MGGELVVGWLVRMLYSALLLLQQMLWG